MTTRFLIRALMIIIVGFLLGLWLAACGGGDEDPKQPETCATKPVICQ